MGIEPSPDGVREAAGASGGQASEKVATDPATGRTCGWTLSLCSLLLVGNKNN